MHRGHLGIPEEIMKAGAAQYASMCNNINNKVSFEFQSRANHVIKSRKIRFKCHFFLKSSCSSCCANKKHMVIPEFASVLEMLSGKNFNFRIKTDFFAVNSNNSFIKTI